MRLYHLAANATSNLLKGWLDDRDANSNLRYIYDIFRCFGLLCPFVSLVRLNSPNFITALTPLLALKFAGYFERRLVYMISVTVNNNGLDVSQARRDRARLHPLKTRLPVHSESLCARLTGSGFGHLDLTIPRSGTSSGGSIYGLASVMTTV